MSIVKLDIGIDGWNVNDDRCGEFSDIFWIIKDMVLIIIKWIRYFNDFGKVGGKSNVVMIIIYWESLVLGSYLFSWNES